MFITRQPYYQRRKFNFTNNLTSKNYSNHDFLNSCGHLKGDIKLSTATSQQDNKNNRQKRYSVIQNRNIECQKGNRNNFVRSSVSNYQIINKSNREISIPNYSTARNKKSKSIINIDRNMDRQSKQPEKIYTKKGSVAQTALSYMTQFINPKKIKAKRSLQRKLAFNPYIDKFYSPYVFIRIIQKIKDLKQIQQKSIKINFEKIYKKLIKTQLMGQFTANFMQTVQRYIREIVEAQQMYINPYGIILQPELKSMSRKQQFLQKIEQLWGDNETLKINELIKYYCIPQQLIGIKMLKDLINDLIIQIYQKKSCNRDIQYILLNDNGEQIVHISQIYFSTLQLLICPKDNYNKIYYNYRNLIQQRDRSLKLNLKQSILHNFIQKIVINKIDKDHINYQNNPHGFVQLRKQSVNKAEKIIDSRSKLRIQYKRQRYDNDNNNDNMDVIQQRSQSRCDLFSRYITRKNTQKRQYKLILQKLQKILDPNRLYIIKSRLHDKTQQQFRKLRLFNDKYDITYNYHPNNINKMLLINLIQNCIIFNQRTTQQLQKLLNMLQIIYGQEYYQFQQIYQTAHGVASPDVIMKFVLNYLNFDQYGELTKSNFYQIMNICLSQTGRPQKIIKQILWNYFQKQGLIQNNILRKQNLSIWFEPVKVVYMLLLSIIFGGQYETVSDMINDLLMEQYQ